MEKTDEKSSTLSDSEKSELLKNFLLEHFDFKELKKVGFYNNDIKKTDYQKQADRLCHFFGYETIFQYRFENSVYQSIHQINYLMSFLYQI